MGFQVVLFVDDKTVSKGMVKYASAIPRESIVDLEGRVVLPQAPIEACSQTQVRQRLCLAMEAGPEGAPDVLIWIDDSRSNH